MDKVYKLGLDIGSTTIKVVLLDGEKMRTPLMLASRTFISTEKT